MTELAIYMEGGGKGDSRAILRQGMDVFLTALKDAARVRSWRWKLVCCGSRHEAMDRFLDRARSAGDTEFVLLLADAEGPVRTSHAAHLGLDGVHDDVVHLMIEIMETWIVADDTALADYYGQRFKRGMLPKARNLETIQKADIMTALDGATQATRKGRYHKIRHAGDLLRRIDPNKVRGRCPSCKRLFETLSRVIAATG